MPTREKPLFPRIFKVCVWQIDDHRGLLCAVQKDESLGEEDLKCRDGVHGLKTQLVDGFSVPIVHRLYGMRARWMIWWAESWLMFKEAATSSMVIRLSTINISLACWMLSHVVKVDGVQFLLFVLRLSSYFRTFDPQKRFYEIRHFSWFWWKSPMNFSTYHISRPQKSARRPQLVDPFLCKRTCLHCRSWQRTDAIVIKQRTQNHRSANSTPGCADATHFKVCYGEIVDNFWLTPVYSCKFI